MWTLIIRPWCRSGERFLLPNPSRIQNEAWIFKGASPKKKKRGVDQDLWLHGSLLSKFKAFSKVTFTRIPFQQNKANPAQLNTPHATLPNLADNLLHRKPSTMTYHKPTWHHSIPSLSIFQDAIQLSMIKGRHRFFGILRPPSEFKEVQVMRKFANMYS